jgi:hypothetical protein
MGRIPLWLKIAYSIWLVIWVPAYWIYNGPANFLWLCDVANFVVALAIWFESPLLLSSQAVSVLLIQILWAVDFLVRLVLGFHPLFGATAYMFEASEPLALRLLSLFHLAMPVLLLWAVWELGYDRRGWLLQTAIAWVVLPVSLLADPERNLNWLWKPFGVHQTWMPPALFLLIAMVAYPLALYYPTHLLLSWWTKKTGRETQQP